jgi:hypothetical protein
MALRLIRGQEVFFLHDYVVVSDDTYSMAQALPYSA